MVSDKIIECSLPIIYEIEPEDDQDFVEDYPYWTKGTCFIVDYEGQLFVVTAKHVIENQMKQCPNPERLLDQVRIVYDEKSKNFFPLCRYLRDESDEHIKDLAILKVANEILKDEDKPFIKSLKLQNLDNLIRCPLSISPNSLLIVRGYPSQISSVDYEQCKIQTKAFVIHARLSGSREKYLYMLNWLPKDIEIIEEELQDKFDPDGMSGSPVFSCKDFSLAGVLILGTRRNGNFISARILYRMLKQIIDNTFIKE